MARTASSNRDQAIAADCEPGGIAQHWKSEPLAARLGISVDTLKKAWHRGELTPIRIGRDLIWCEDEILAWLEAHREPGRLLPEPELARRHTNP